MLFEEVLKSLTRPSADLVVEASAPLSSPADTPETTDERPSRSPSKEPWCCTVFHRVFFGGETWLTLVLQVLFKFTGDRSRGARTSPSPDELVGDRESEAIGRLDSLD